jgi:hypothetical protein
MTVVSTYLRHRPRRRASGPASICRREHPPIHGAVWATSSHSPSPASPSTPTDDHLTSPHDHRSPMATHPRDRVSILPDTLALHGAQFTALVRSTDSLPLQRRASRMLDWTIKSNSHESAGSSPSSQTSRAKSEHQAPSPALPCQDSCQEGSEDRVAKGPSWAQLITQKLWSHLRTSPQVRQGRETASRRVRRAYFPFFISRTWAGVLMGFNAAWLDEHELLVASRLMDEVNPCKHSLQVHGISCRRDQAGWSRNRRRMSFTYNVIMIMNSFRVLIGETNHGSLQQIAPVTNRGCGDSHPGSFE